MKNFACLILGLGLLVNLTMANIIDNNAIDRFKRGSERIRVFENSISATKKSFIDAQIKTLYKSLGETPHKWELAQKLSSGLRNKFGGYWIVIICEIDEICSYWIGTPSNRYKVIYGTTIWGVYKVSKL